MMSDWLKLSCDIFLFSDWTLEFVRAKGNSSFGLLQANLFTFRDMSPRLIFLMEGEKGKLLRTFGLIHGNKFLENHASIPEL